MTQRKHTKGRYTGPNITVQRPGSGEHPDHSLTEFFGSDFTVLSQTDTGLHLRNNATGDILFLGADIGHDLETGADASWLNLQLNGRSLPDEFPDVPGGHTELPPPWKLWQEDDDPRGNYYTLNVWPLTLVIDPHQNEVLVQIVDLDQPVARRTGINSLTEGCRIALELAANVLTDWQINIRQAVLPEINTAPDEPEMDAWQFEQYGDTDDPTDGYYTRHLGPFQLVVEPTALDAHINILDPDFLVIRTGLTSVAEAKRVAGDLLHNTLTGWLAELDEWQKNGH
jgi:hypothetical protein